MSSISKNRLNRKSTSPVKMKKNFPPPEKYSDFKGIVLTDALTHQIFVVCDYLSAVQSRATSPPMEDTTTTAGKIWKHLVSGLVNFILPEFYTQRVFEEWFIDMDLEQDDFATVLYSLMNDASIAAGVGPPIPKRAKKLEVGAQKKSTSSVLVELDKMMVNFGLKEKHGELNNGGVPQWTIKENNRLSYFLGVSDRIRDHCENRNGEWKWKPRIDDKVKNETTRFMKRYEQDRMELASYQRMVDCAKLITDNPITRHGLSFLHIQIDMVADEVKKLDMTCCDPMIRRYVEAQVAAFTKGCVQQSEDEKELEKEFEEKKDFEEKKELEEENESEDEVEFEKIIKPKITDIVVDEELSTSDSDDDGEQDFTTVGPEGNVLTPDNISLSSYGSACSSYASIQEERFQAFDDKTKDEQENKEYITDDEDLPESRDDDSDETAVDRYLRSRNHLKLQDFKVVRYGIERIRTQTKLPSGTKTLCNHFGYPAPQMHFKDWRRDGHKCVCGQKFNTYEKLDRHAVKLQESTILRCGHDKCTFVTNRKCCLTKHHENKHETVMLTHRAERRVYECQWGCYKLFASKHRLFQHNVDTARSCKFENATWKPPPDCKMRLMLFMEQYLQRIVKQDEAILATIHGAQSQSNEEEELTKKSGKISIKNKKKNENGYNKLVKDEEAETTF